MEEKNHTNSGVTLLIVMLFILVILLVTYIFVSEQNNVKSDGDIINNSGGVTVSSYESFLDNVKSVRQTHLVKEYVRSKNGAYSVSINQIGYLYIDDTMFVDVKVLLFWVVPSGSYNNIYYIKEDGTFYVATETADGTFEPEQLSAKNILSVMPTKDGGKSIGTGYNLKYNYDNFLKNAKSLRQMSGIQKTVKVYDTEYSIRLNEEGALYVEDKKLDTDVVIFYSLYVGNGGFESLYYLKEDGSLYTASYSYNIYKGEEIEVKKLNFENIVSVIPGKALTASYPIFIDIDGNVYTE